MFKKTLLTLCIIIFSITNVFPETVEEEIYDYSYLLTVNVLSPFIGVYAGDFETKIDQSSSLRIGAVYFNPDLIPFKDLVETKLTVKSNGNTYELDNPKLYTLNTLLQYNWHLISFPSGLYAGLGLEYQFINIASNINSSIPKQHHNFVPFALFGLQDVQDHFLWRMEAGADYMFPLTDLDGIVDYYMLESSKSKGFRFFFHFALGVGF